ncbi:DUF7344 domain-containing protein [Halobaculum gomorrense]|uniref:DUF7344 domain-containing protein n=1 Tax=Halobaculum gomorrense TaxID=43928 RepID=A0A1M5TN50_9EURY|nr:hypothetical protein [Halobaculum gomorrense]SHH52134.1 hypothetical protein SAMN05443636_2776 [Halobaculum gomorrense]
MANKGTDQRGEGQAGERVTLADDELYRAFASKPRRRLLHLLLDADAGSRSVDELATLLSGWEAADSGSAVSPNEHVRTRIALTHVHLPRLAELNLIEYDPTEGAVSATAVDPAVATVIERSVADVQSVQQ